MLHCIFFLKQNGATLDSQMLNWDFVSHLLKKIRHSEREQALRPPMWKQKALRLSFKTYNLEDVQRALRTIDCRSLLIQILQWHYRKKHKQTPVVRVVLRWRPQRARQQQSCPLFALKLTLALDRGEQLESVNLFGVQYLTVPPVVC